MYALVCNVLLLALCFSNLAKRTAECNVVMLHKLGAIPFGLKYEPDTVAMYCIICMYMYIYHTVYWEIFVEF